MSSVVSEMVRQAHRQAEAHTVIRTAIQGRCDNPNCADMAGDNARPDVGCGRCDVTASRIMTALQSMVRT